MSKSKSKARRELGEVERKLADLKRRERELTLDQYATRDRVNTLKQQLAEAIEREALALDGSVPEGSDQQRLLGELAVAESEASENRWEAVHQGIAAARSKQEAARMQLVNDHFAELRDELIAEAGEVAAELAAESERLATIEGRWVSVAAGWEALHRVLGPRWRPDGLTADPGNGAILYGVSFDAPPFPLQPAGEIGSGPVPEVFDPANQDDEPAVEIPTA